MKNNKLEEMMMVKNIWIASDLPLNLVELIKKIFNDLEIKDNQIVNFDYARENDRYEFHLEYEMSNLE